VPHSLVVSKHYAPDETPTELTGQDAALPRAYSKSPQVGQVPGDEDQLRFKARKAGTYMWACGVASHLLTGMWVNFEVKEGLGEARMVVNEGQIAPDDQAGWK
jgi:Sulfocyanin (SoxE) domain